MTRFSHFAALGLAILMLAGCGAPPNGAAASGAAAPGASPPGAATRSAAPSELLARLFDRYWDERIAYEDAISPQILADSLEVEKRYLAELLTIPREALDSQGRLNYDIFRRQRETAVEGFTYPGELMPVNPFAGMPLKFAVAAAQSAESSLTAAQYERWLKAADDYVRWTRQAIANMRDGVLRGYTSPRALVERMLPILESLGADTDANVFYTLLRSVPQDMVAADRERLRAGIHDAVSQKVLPATRALHDYLQNEYLPKARSGVSLADLPLGLSWYEYRVRRAVGVGAVLANIHRAGLSEVERLRPRLQSLANPANGMGAASPPAAAAQPPAISDALAAYEDLGAQLTANLPTSFGVESPASYEIRAVNFVPMPATPLYYRPAMPGAIEAVLFVNATELKGPPDIGAFLQQAVPGHHLQNAIQQQRADLPRFRRFGADPAFVAGWGLYAAKLGEELGMYPSDADKYRALKLQMRCAVALVIDTGLHSQGWTRAKALEYLHTQASLEESDAQALIDEYTAMPGDALSCATGAMKIQALRARTQNLLGGRFELREFHVQVLKDGAMPLDILEGKLNTWIEASR